MAKEKKPASLRDYLNKQPGGATVTARPAAVAVKTVAVAAKPNPAYAGLPPDLRAIMERQDREGLMKIAAAAQSKGAVSGNNVQAGQQAKANAAARAETARQQALAREDAGLSGLGRGLKGRRKAIDKLTGKGR